MCAEINTIIFSKNRACQLDLLLRNFNMLPAVVIYTYDPEFASGYEKIINMYPDIKFEKQIDLKQQILANLGTYTMFEVDDDIMLEHFHEDCPEFQELKTNPDILCLSLRLCPTYGGYPGDETNRWKWRGQRHSWGYPMSVTATIFRKEDIEKIIQKMSYAEIPHNLEMTIRKYPPNRPLMLCFNKPKFITNEANIVQNVYPTKNFGVDVKMLEERFLKGDRLSLEYMKEAASMATGCFMRMDYKWE